MSEWQPIEKAYWLRDKLLPPFDAPPPAKTDVLVVGGGYTGLSAAIRLRKAGTEVAVIDSRSMATAASARNGGMALTGLSESVSVIVKRHGLEMARELYIESVASVAETERLINEGGIDCGFRRSGFLLAAFKPGHVTGLREQAELLNTTFGQRVEFIPRERLREEELNSPIYHGALFDPLGAGLHPARYVAGLALLANKLGARLHENVEARRIDKRAGGFEIETTRGTIHADKVIVATNGYTESLTPWQRRRIVPVRSLMIATEEMDPAETAALMPTDRMVADTKIFLYYFRRSPDGRRILFGGRPNSPKLSLAENSVFMRRNMVEVFPSLADKRIDYCWWGRLGFTMDHMPRAGERDGLLYAMGYCGHGAALATWLGSKLAEAALGKGLNTAFSRTRFRAIPFYNGEPWFLPLVYRWFSFKDRLY